MPQEPIKIRAEKENRGIAGGQPSSPITPTCHGSMCVTSWMGQLVHWCKIAAYLSWQAKNMEKPHLGSMIAVQGSSRRA